MKEEAVDNSAQTTPEETLTETNSEPEIVDSDQNIAKIAELVNDLQRTRADFENFRKQAELQKVQSNAATRYATVQKFLPLVDDFSRAISAYPEQLDPLAKNFDKTLKSLGLRVVDSKTGAVFNPDLHEAISVDDSEGEIEVIAETLRPGYIYEDTVIRPAMVKVTHK